MPTSEPRVAVTTATPTVSIVALAGGHDLASAREIVSAFEELAAASRNIVADLSNVTFFDTTTIHSLVVGRRLALAVGARFVVCVPPEHPAMRMLELMRLLELAPVVNSVEQAITTAAEPVSGATA
jgi:anti-anti-sigma factor